MNDGSGAISFAADEFWLLHEHAEHPDFKCVVNIEYIGGDTDYFSWCTADGKIIPMTDAEKTVHGGGNEAHALIYTDGCIAVTMYECCFAFWYLHRGELASGCLWKKGEWRLTPASIDKIRRVHEALR